MSKDKIEVNMNVHDIPIVVEELEKAEKEISRLNNIINEALGIANERVNYYNHKRVEVEDWSEIFNVLVKRDNKELKGSVVN